MANIGEALMSKISFNGNFTSVLPLFAKLEMGRFPQEENLFQSELPNRLIQGSFGLHLWIVEISARSTTQTPLHRVLENDSAIVVSLFLGKG